MVRATRGARLLPLLVTLLVLAALHPAAADGGDTQTATYVAPSSFVLQDVFGFGKLLCADPATADAGNVIQNGACFSYDAADVGRPFQVIVDDAVWDNASISVAVDVNGDGCVSASCSGQPNPANDYLIAGCGGVSGVLPPVEPGVAHTLQAFVRALDVDPAGNVCGATTGTLTLHLF